AVPPTLIVFVLRAYSPDKHLE
ncbi:unnamed protein product, partial [Rotaria magnacalcarata]